MPRRLTAEDHDAWARYAAGVTPLPGRAPIPPPAGPPPVPRVQPVRPPPAPAARAAPAPAQVDGRPAGLDSASWERLRSGKLRPERKLDLHGRTVQAAFHAFRAFLAHAHADRLRVVEIVTGRGNAGEAEARGRIRREFPVWLNLPEIRPRVLAAVHPHQANQGAVLLLLRRVR